MKNKAKVHRLPTEDYTSVVVSNKGELEYTYGEQINGYQKHLYITTDEEIKEGDWFINTGSGGHPTPKVYQANFENSKAFKEFGPYPEIRKIIATTDPKLNEVNNKDKVDESWFRPLIPKIPQSFIEEYCKAGGIDEVLVEYTGGRWDYKRYDPWKSIETNGKIDYTWVEGVAYESIKHLPKNKIRQLPIEPKLDNNCIIIHPVEEKMYSLEEVKTKCKEAFHAGAKHQLEWSKANPITLDTGETIRIVNSPDRDKWIEENL